MDQLSLLPCPVCGKDLVRSVTCELCEKEVCGNCILPAPQRGNIFGEVTRVPAPAPINLAVVPEIRLAKFFAARKKVRIKTGRDDAMLCAGCCR